MVTSKNELFETELQESAELFKVLSHPARLMILKYLSETRNCITGDISEALPLGRTTVNQHLSALKTAGLIHGNISGAKTYYCINGEKLLWMRQVAEKFIGSVCCGNSCCEPKSSNT